MSTSDIELAASEALKLDFSHLVKRTVIAVLCSLILCYCSVVNCYCCYFCSGYVSKPFSRSMKSFSSIKNYINSRDRISEHAII